MEKQLTPCTNPAYLKAVRSQLNDELLERYPGCLEWTADDPRNEEFAKQSEADDDATLGLLYSCPKLSFITPEAHPVTRIDPGACQLAADEMCPLEPKVQALRAIYGEVELDLDEH